METYDIRLSSFAEYNLLNIYCYIAESFSVETAKYTSHKIGSMSIFGGQQLICSVSFT